MIVLTKEEAAVTASIRTVAESRGLSVRKLAALADLPFKTVHNVLAGASSPRFGTISRLAKALEVSIESLENGVPAPTTPKRRSAS